MIRIAAVKSEDFILSLAGGRAEAKASGTTPSCEALNSISEDFHAMLRGHCSLCSTGTGHCVVRSMQSLEPELRRGEVIEFAEVRQHRQISRDR